MRAPFELRRLGELRREGRAPLLPVIVTDLERLFAENLLGAGVMVIPSYGNAETWEWSAVSGLEVLLAPRDAASSKTRDLAVVIKAARPRWLRLYDFQAPVGERTTTMVPT